jgi:hypothetical protein
LVRYADDHASGNLKNKEDDDEDEDEDEDRDLDCYGIGVHSFVPTPTTTSIPKSALEIHKDPLKRFQMDFYSYLVGKTASQASKEVAWALIWKGARVIKHREEQTGRRLKWPVYKTLRNDVQRVLPKVRFDFAIRDNRTGEIVKHTDMPVITRVFDIDRFQVLYNAAVLKVKYLIKALIKLFFIHK